ncbi:superoxide dismutase [Escherichia coli]|nr:Superoxide dismutase [Cu-Zn] [Escherichia coli]VEC63967.1 superoxide dismutase [Escherichia coli]
MNGGPMKRFSLAILALVVATGAQAASEKSR